jgi:hypothetical protein
MNTSTDRSYRTGWKRMNAAGGMRHVAFVCGLFLLLFAVALPPRSAAAQSAGQAQGTPDPVGLAAQAAPLPPRFENRNTALGLLRSYYNAVNRREYRRAFDYIESNAFARTFNAAAYRRFAQGYANTAAVVLSTGVTRTEGAAGSVFTSIPTVLVATHTNGRVQRFYGCYVMRRTRVPSSNSESAFWHIYSARIRVAPAGVAAARLLALGCQ